MRSREQKWGLTARRRPDAPHASSDTTEAGPRRVPPLIACGGHAVGTEKSRYQQHVVSYNPNRSTHANTKNPGEPRFLGALRRKPSAGLAVRRRLVAARAVLRQLETIRRVTTVLLGDVVALLALRAGQSDLGANVLGLACHGCFPRFVLSLARPVGSKNW